MEYIRPHELGVLLKNYGSIKAMAEALKLQIQNIQGEDESATKLNRESAVWDCLYRQVLGNKYYGLHQEIPING